jgi:hypothetical protein
MRGRLRAEGFIDLGITADIGNAGSLGRARSPLPGSPLTRSIIPFMFQHFAAAMAFGKAEILARRLLLSAALRAAFRIAFCPAVEGELLLISTTTTTEEWAFLECPQLSRVPLSSAVSLSLDVVS